jgi:2Fe-2S ferredoxin
VREPHLDALPAISEDEEEMLECTAAPRDERRSRLGCQLTLGAGGLEEVEVDVPATQI